MTHPGYDTNAPGQPAGPDGAWVPPTTGQPHAGQPAGAAKKGNARKWMSLAGTVAAVGVGGAYTLTGGFGLGDPKVNDCVQMQGETSFEVVDCTSADAEYKIVGIHDEELTYLDMTTDPDVCSAFQTWEVALWIGDLETEPGTIYCSEPV